MLFGYLLSAALSVPALKEQTLRLLDAIPHKTWTAGMPDRFADMTEADFDTMLMDARFLKGGPAVPYMTVDARSTEIPESYDFRDAYPNCNSPVQDQGHCGSCWSFSATSAFSDRRCMARLDPESVVYSQQYEVSCDKYDSGCEGGFLPTAWNFFMRTGVPTKECVSYKKETAEDGESGLCPSACDNGDDIQLFTAKGRAMNVGHGNVENIKAALVKYGPLTTGFTVYEDFRHYTGGVYQAELTKMLGGHAVEIVGYGKEGDIDFWTIRNSWGPDWGEKGFFRIIRGVNECGIEDQVMSGRIL